MRPIVALLVFTTITATSWAEERKMVYLSNLPELAVRVGNFDKVSALRFGKNGDLGYSYSSPPIKRAIVNDTDYKYAIAMGPASNDYASVKYKLNKKAVSFVSQVAQQDKAVPQATSYFFVIGDGKVLWKSGASDKPGRYEECEVNVTGVSILELRVSCNGSSVSSIPLWLDPYLVLDR